MAEQLRLLDVKPTPPRLSPATILLGKAGVAACRAILAEAIESQTNKIPGDKVIDLSLAS